MSGRAWTILLLALGVLGWWRSPYWPGRISSPAQIDGPCPLPPRVAGGVEPLQSPVPPAMQPFRFQDTTLVPLAGFSIEARVLSREDYRSDRESQLSPTDLALGWGRMRRDDVLAGLEISQAGRWYRYQWTDMPPIPADEIARSSANMHLIPATAAAARALDNVDTDDRVRIEGWLVEASRPDGWRWRSSTTRTDTGAGACEVIYVCGLTRL